MSENDEAKPRSSDKALDQAAEERKDLHIAAGDAVATGGSVTVEILNRAETEAKERERGMSRLSAVVAATGIVASVLGILTAFAKNLSDVAGVVGIAVAATAVASSLVAAFSSPDALERVLVRSFSSKAPGPDLPPGLRALRDRLALERRDALAGVHRTVANPRKD